MDILKKNQISALADTNYYCSKEQELRKELLKEALLDSKSKAELLADANQQILQGIEKNRRNRNTRGSFGFNVYRAGKGYET